MNEEIRLAGLEFGLRRRLQQLITPKKKREKQTPPTDILGTGLANQAGVAMRNRSRRIDDAVDYAVRGR